MSSLLMNRRLRWKETRQLVPMVFTLVAMVLIFLIFGAVAGTAGNWLLSIYGLGAPPKWFDGLGQLVLGLPGLFAAGTGCLLIGMEKEQKTIQWLANLPIPPQAIVKSKLMVGLFSLVVVWIVCGTVGWILIANEWGSALTRENTLTFAEISRWVLHTAYLLIAGMAINWKFKSPFISLIVLIPIALAPYGIAWLVQGTCGQHAWAFFRTHEVDRVFYFANVAALVGLTVLSLGLVFRFGNRALTAEPIHPGSIRAAIREGYRSTDTSAGYQAKRTPAAAMLWQSAAQNRNWLIFFSGMLLAAILIQMYSIYDSTYRLGYNQTLSREVVPDFESIQMSGAGTPLKWLLTHLAFCGLGILAFQGDRHASRIRFLADRGVSPLRIWITRHIVPLTIIATYIVLLIAFSASVYGWSQVSIRSVVIVFLALSSYAVGVYAFSQWTGQLLGNPVLAAIVAPIISFAFIGFGIFCFNVMGTPIWLIALLLAVPFVITWKFMPKWMDRRSNWQTWAIHLGAAISLLAIPFVWTGIQYARTPTISAELRDTILNKVPDIQAASGKERSTQATLLFLDQPDKVDSETGSPPVAGQKARFTLSPDFAEFQRNRLKQLELQLNRHNGQFNGNIAMIPQFLTGYIGMTRALWEQSEPDQESIDSYRLAMRLTSDFVAAIRESGSLRNQEVADVLEIFLLNEIKRPDTLKILEQDLYGPIISRLADTDGRKDARLRSIAYTFRSDKSHFNFGDFYLPEELSQTHRFSILLGSRRLLDAAAGDLWQFASDASRLKDASFMERLAKAWGETPDAYGKSQPDPSVTIFFEHSGPVNVWGPGRLWHGKWEREAKELAEWIPVSNSMNEGKTEETDKGTETDHPSKETQR